MSMLSAQCDELRSMAESVGLAMPQAATLMMEAADTIERLREQAEDMDFQLDKWQTKAEYFKQLADLAEADRLRNDAENAKLRKLVGLWSVINKHMSLCATTNCGQCPVREECGESVYLEGLLGIDPKGLSWRVQERMAETTDVQAENAKLRELARDVNKAAHMLCEAWEGSCSKEADGMSLYAVCPISDTNELCVFGKLHDRMRELGVVVE